MKKSFALCFTLLLLPITASGQGERYNLSLGDYRYPRYNTLDANIPNYIIVRGDNLWNLALRYYGVGQEWRYIWEHNAYIKDPHWIYPGNPLFIPGMQRADNPPTAQPQTIQPPPIALPTLPLEFSDIFGDSVKTDTAQTQIPPPIDIIVEVIDSVPEAADTIPEEAPTLPAKAESGRKRYFVFSLRPEMLSANTITGIGADMELGAISAGGFYFSLDLSGGKFYYGGGFDMGGCLGKDKGVKSVFGVCGGYWNLISIVNVVKNDNVLDSAIGSNISYGGGFWKLMFGRTVNIDITNKVLIGFKNDPVGYDEDGKTFIYDTSIKPIWSASVGLTFLKKKKKRGK